MISLESISYYIGMILLPYCSGDVDFYQVTVIVKVNVGLLACLSVLRTVQLGLASVAMASSVLKLKKKYSALLTSTQKERFFVGPRARVRSRACARGPQCCMCPVCESACECAAAVRAFEREHACVLSVRASEILV